MADSTHGKTDEEVEASIRVEGHVKWFDTAKGYGFVVLPPDRYPEIKDDVLLHISCLRTYDVTNADEGAKISCDVARRDKGWQVIDIIEMDRPRAVMLQGEDLKFERLVVKWFNEAKGYGFVQRPGQDQDIFLHIVVLRQSGRETAAPGDLLDGVIETGNKGAHAALIKPAEGFEE